MLHVLVVIALTRVQRATVAQEYLRRMQAQQTAIRRLVHPERALVDERKAKLCYYLFSYGRTDSCEAQLSAVDGDLQHAARHHNELDEVQ